MLEGLQVKSMNTKENEEIGGMSGDTVKNGTREEMIQVNLKEVLIQIILLKVGFGENMEGEGVGI